MSDLLRKCFFFGLVLTSLSSASAIAQQANGGNWQRVEADNGAVYQVDMSSIDRIRNGTATVRVWVVQGTNFNPRNLRWLWFDCRGAYRDISQAGHASTLYAPPRSVIGRISGIACGPPKGSNGRGDSEGQSKSDASRSQGEVTAGQNYKIELRASGGQFPRIIGFTNLPDETKLLVSISKPRLPNGAELLSRGLPACEDNCIPASGPKGETLGVATIALAGAFSAGPFSWNGKPFRSGSYEVEVYLYSQPGEDVLHVESAAKLSERMARPIFKSVVKVVADN